MSLESTTSSDSEYRYFSLAQIQARMHARRAEAKQRRADHAAQVAAIECERRERFPDVVFPTYDEMEKAVVRSGDLWTSPESMASLIDLHNKCVASMPTYAEPASPPSDESGVSVISQGSAQ
jgi:hypothetical protein